MRKSFRGLKLESVEAGSQKAPIRGAWSSCRHLLWRRHVKSIERRGNKGIEADQVDELSRINFAEGLDGEAPGYFRQRTAAAERIGDVKCYPFLAGKIVRLYVRDECGYPSRRHAHMFGDRDMGVDFIARLVEAADNKDGDLPDNGGTGSK